MKTRSASTLLASLGILSGLGVHAAAQSNPKLRQKPWPAARVGAGSSSQAASASGVAGGFALVPSVLASGNADDCSTAKAIAGAGPFAFDTLAATTGPQQGLACGTGVCANDVWFQWTASATGVCTLTLCGGGAGFDSLVAVYAGSGCPSGAALACNDDSCGLVSQLSFVASAGSSYMLQIGAFSAAYAGTGTFTLTVVPPPSNDDCNTPANLSGLGTFGFDDSFATTGSEGQSEPLCNFGGQTGIDADLWYTWTAPSTATYQLETCGTTSVDTKMAVYLGAGCPTSGALACNDDACGFQSRLVFVGLAGQTYTFQVGSFPGAPRGAGGLTLSVYSVAVANDDPCFSPGSLFSLPTTTDGTPIDCSAASQTAPAYMSNCYSSGFNEDLWYSWTSGTSSAGSISYTFSFCPNLPTGFTPGINVWDDGGTCQLNNIACGSLCGGSELCLNATPNHTYWIQLGSDANGSGAWSSGTSVNITITQGCTLGIRRCDPGTGGVIACPCGNPPGASERGCDNSSGTGGARIDVGGNNSLSSDTVVFSTSGQKPTGTSILLQGSALLPAGVVFGQGVRCTAGALRRLYTKSAVGGSITAPSGGDPSVSARSAALGDVLGVGSTRYYQVYYRDPVVLGGCSATSTFNITDLLELTWNP